MCDRNRWTSEITQFAHFLINTLLLVKELGSDIIAGNKWGKTKTARELSPADAI